MHGIRFLGLRLAIFPAKKLFANALNQDGSFCGIWHLCPPVTLCDCGRLGRVTQPRHPTRQHMQGETNHGSIETARDVANIWVVVKTMVPFWVPNIVRHLIFSFDNHPFSAELRQCWPPAPSKMKLYTLHDDGAFTALPGARQCRQAQSSITVRNMNDVSPDAAMYVPLAVIQCLLRTDAMASVA